MIEMWEAFKEEAVEIRHLHVISWEARLCLGRTDTCFQTVFILKYC